MKKQLMTVLALAAACCTAPAFAADAASAPTMGKQQTRMAECNKDAGDKKGDERKGFMKTCLSNKRVASQQDKMRTCNADPKAKTMKGDARKSFMKECLSA